MSENGVSIFPVLGTHISRFASEHEALITDSAEDCGTLTVRAPVQ